MRANENQKNQSDYFSILEVIDKIFPPIGEFDYTKISTDELITRFESKIKEIASIREEIKSKHNDIYGKIDHVSKKSESINDFNQRNYVIQNYVSSLKNIVIYKICNEYLKYLYNGEGNNQYNNLYIGNNNNIRKYIASTLNVTKEAADDGYHLKWENITKDILFHLGINPYKKESLSSSDFLINLSEKIKNIFDSTIRYNEYFYTEKGPQTIEEIADKITEFILNLLSYDTPINIEDYQNYFSNPQSTLSATIKH